MKQNLSQDEFLTEIRVVNNISLTVPENKKILNRIPLIIVALLGIFGTLFSFFSMYETGVEITTIVYLSLLYFTVFTVIFMLPRKFSIILVPIAILYGFLLFQKFSEFKNGFKMLYNSVYENIYPDSLDYFRVKDKDTENIEVFLAFTLFILIFVICYSVLSDPNFFLGFIVTFLIVETGFYFGKSPGLVYAFMLIIYWVSLATLKYCGYYDNNTKKSTGFYRKNNMFIAKPGIRFYTSGLSVTVITVICCIIFALTSFFSAITDYQRSEKINTMRSDMKFAAREFSFDNLGESLQRFSASLGIEPIKAYTHKLGVIGNVSFKNKCELTVETDGAIDSDVYLKGYTGAVYTGDEWEDFPDYIYENREEMFEEFSETKTFPQDMLTNYFFNRYDLYYVNMNITSEYNNEKYNYIPYISIPKGEITYTADTLTTLENKKSYGFQVNKLQLTKSNFTDVLSGLNYSINDSFDEYTEFVYDNYTDYDKTTGLDEVYKRFVRGTVLDSDADVYQKLVYIKELLDENASYTLNPGRTPSNEDFVKYFLVNSHKGYCMHFATAGIVLARMAGIPARYCDGYVLCAEDFNNKNRQANGGYKIQIEDSRAHAWAEIYIENLGWVPFEFTAAGPAFGEQQPQQTTRVTTTTAEKKTSRKTISKSITLTTQTELSSISKQTNAATAVSVKKDAIKLPLSVKITLIVVGIVILALVILALRHYIETVNKQKKLNSENKKESITFAYGYILKLLKFCGTDRKNMQYLEFAEYAAEKIPDILDERFVKVTEVMLKAQLSGELSDGADAKIIAEYYREIFDRIYKKSNIIRKLEMKFIKNL